MSSRVANKKTPVSKGRKKFLKAKRKEQAMEPKAQKGISVASSFKKNGIVETTCGSNKAMYNFKAVDDPDWFNLGKMLWVVICKKGYASFDFGPGDFAQYLKCCFAWYCKHFGAWREPDDNLISCGQFFIPYGIGLLFRQSSSFTHKDTGVTVMVDLDWTPASIPYGGDRWAGVGPSNAGNTVEPVLTAGPIAIPALTSNFMENLSEVINAVFDDAFMLEELKWGATSGELFCGASLTSLFPCYAFGRYCIKESVLQFEGYRSPGRALDASMFALELILMQHHNGRTICAVLVNNGYEPIYLSARAISINGSYAAQIINAVFDVVPGADDEDRYMWIMCAWAYILSFTPAMCAFENYKRMANYQFTSWKMPFALQYLAKQMSFKVVNTFLYPQWDVEYNWSRVSLGQATNGWSGMNNPGYVSLSVPEEIKITPQGTFNVYDSNHFTSSWSIASMQYKYLQSKYPQLFSLACPIDPKMVPCGCTAEIVDTKLSEVLTDPNLGSLSLRSITTLYCPGAMPQGMCKKASAFTIVNNNFVSAHTLKLSAVTSSLVAEMVSLTTAGSTNASVIAAGRGGVEKMISAELNGTTQRIIITKKDLKRLAKSFVGSNPITPYLSDKTRQIVAASAPDSVTADWIYNVVSWLGEHAVGAVVDLAASKAFSLVRPRVEL